jgi:hypothetical protein
MLCYESIESLEGKNPAIAKKYFDLRYDDYDMNSIVPNP